MGQDKMDRELSNLIKELLIIIDEFRMIDSPEIVQRLQSEGDAGLIYSTDFVDTYEGIRSRMETLGELPPHLRENY
jgi:hypothetical protein